MRSVLPLKTLVTITYERLKPICDENFIRESWLLLEWALEKTRLDYIVYPETPIAYSAQEKLYQAIEKRISGVPFSRIIGKASFYGLDFYLNEDCLDPRQDTEILVDALIDIVKKHMAEKEKISMLDFGVGSGAISISALFHVKNLEAFGLDIAQDALNIAQKNAQYHNVQKRFTCIYSKGFENLTGVYDLFVSNPPYIPSATIKTLSQEVQNFDPYRALDGGKNGLDFYQMIALEGRKYTHKDSFFILEIGIEQEECVKQIFLEKGYHFYKHYYDLQNLIRVLIFRP